MPRVPTCGLGATAELGTTCGPVPALVLKNGQETPPYPIFLEATVQPKLADPTILTD